MDGSPSSVVSMGFGSWGSVGLVVTLGFGISANVTTTRELTGYWGVPSHTGSWAVPSNTGSWGVPSHTGSWDSED